MNEIRIHHYTFLPLVDILWHPNLRQGLEFLKEASLLLELFEAFKKRQKLKNIKKFPFVLRYGAFNLDWNRDSYIYIRQLLEEAHNREPLRPLVNLTTKRVKWRAIKTVISKARNYVASVVLNSNLIAESYRSFTVSRVQSQEFDEILEVSEKIFQREITSDKKAILSSIFTDISSIYISSSEILTIIECPISMINKIYSTDIVTTAERFPGCWLKELRKNRWLIIYGSAHPHKKLRERVKKALTSAITLKHAFSRIEYLLNSGTIDSLPTKLRVKFVEYALASFNPQYYSAILKKTYYLPTHYQRLIFNYVQKKFNADSRFNSVRELIVKRIAKWNPYDQMFLLSRKNIVITKLKEEFKPVKDGLYKKPECLEENKKMDIIIKIMLNYYKNLIESDRTNYAKKMLEHDKSFGAMSLHKLKEEYQSWLIEHDLTTKDTELTINFFRQKTIPKLLSDLEEEGLINIIPVEHAREKIRYGLNINHPFIRAKLFH